MCSGFVNRRSTVRIRSVALLPLDTGRGRGDRGSSFRAIHVQAFCLCAIWVCLATELSGGSGLVFRSSFRHRRISATLRECVRCRTGFGSRTSGLRMPPFRNPHFFNPPVPFSFWTLRPFCSLFPHPYSLLPFAQTTTARPSPIVMTCRMIAPDSAAKRSGADGQVRGWRGRLPGRRRTGMDMAPGT